MKRLIAVGAALVVLAAAETSPAASPEDTARARTFFEAGAAAYASGRYADAVRSFEQAYALAPRTTVLFSLAQAERKDFLERRDATSLQHAIAHYTEYLAKVPSGGRRPEALEAKTDLEAKLARLDPRDTVNSAAPRRPRLTVFSPTAGAQVSVDAGAPSELPYFADLEPGKHVVRVFADGYFDAEQEISGDKGLDVPVSLALRERPALVNFTLTDRAEVFVDGRLVAETPLARPLEVAPGPHVVSIARNGRRAWSQELVFERAKRVTLHPQLVTSAQRYVAYSLLGAGAASVVASGAFGLVALTSESRARDLEDKRARENLTPGELADHNDAIERRDGFRTATFVAGGVGLGALAGGLLLFAFDRPPVALVPPRTEPDPKQASPVDLATLRITPFVGGGVFGGGIGGAF